MKVKNDHRSKFSNLSNWKGEAWKNQGFNEIRTRDLRVTGALLYQLSYEATHLERGQFIYIILYYLYYCVCINIDYLSWHMLKVLLLAWPQKS